MSHLRTAIENHPSLGWFGSFIAMLLSWLSWLIENSNHIAQVFGVGAAVFGFMAGYYTWRIQRATWQERKRKRRGLYE